MNKVSVVLLLSVTAVLSSSSYAATAYVLANDNNPNGNTLSAYALDTITGDLTRIAVLQTGGLGLGTIRPNDFAYVEQAITQDAGCIFVMDVLSSDIASFSAATHYARVGNYSNPALDASFIGGTIALTPNGKFLYASYSGTANLGAWAVGADCSLALVGVYGTFGPPLKVTPNGEGLIAIAPTNVGVAGAASFGIDLITGALTEVGNLPLAECGVKCSPTGIDFTKDNGYVVFSGNYATDFSNIPMAWTVQLTRGGLVHPRAWKLNPGALTNNNVPLLSAAAYAGSGYLYFGASGDSGCGTAGVIATNFTEKPLSIEPANATVIESPNCWDGQIAMTGNLMVVAEYPNRIGVFAVNADGSLTPLSTTIDENTIAMFSLSVFPNTR